MPAELDIGADGKPRRLVCHFGPGMDSEAMVTAWNAPCSFAVGTHDFVVEGPPVATEWSVQGKSDGRCVVRVENSLYSNSDERDVHLLGVEAGWPAFFRILQIYMADFGGQPCARLDLPGAASKESPAWETLAAGLGIAGAEVGERRCAPAGAPRLVGLVDRVPDVSEIIMRLDEPACGAGHLLAMAAQDQFIISVRLYLYGDGAAEVVERYLPRWRAWMQERFPVRES